MSHKKRSPKAHMCGEKMCWNCEEFVDPNTHRCYMKPIVFQQDDDQDPEDQQEQGRQKGNRRRKVMNKKGRDICSSISRAGKTEDGTLQIY